MQHSLYIRVSEAIDELVLIVGVIHVGVTPFYNVSENYQIEAQMGQSSRSFRYWPDLIASAHRQMRLSYDILDYIFIYHIVYS